MYYHQYNLHLDFVSKKKEPTIDEIRRELTRVWNSEPEEFCEYLELESTHEFETRVEKEK